METPYILEMRQVDKSFPGVHALDHVDFFLKPGEVHALAGENGAGKSTLMKILSGSYQLDSGKIILKGKQIHFTNSRQARESGISIIHQELNLVPQMNAAQNIFLGMDEETARLGIITKRERTRRAKEILQSINVSVNLNTPVANLSVAHQQMIEIAKALTTEAEILVMDEPTSSLTDREIHTLYDVINSLKQRGVAIIYISHRLDEIFHLADNVTVLRDGRNVDTVKTSDLTVDQLVCMMVGRELKRFFHRERPGSAEWSGQLAKQLASSLLKEFPDIKGIYAANDTMALGVLEALDEAGKSRDVAVIGTDGTSVAVESVQAGKLKATIGVFPYDYGWAAVELAIRALEGQKLPARIDWPHTLLTTKNIPTFFPNCCVQTARGKIEFGPFQDNLGVMPTLFKPYTIGVVLKTYRNKHWKEMGDGYLAAAEHYGVKVKVISADSEADLEQQLTLTEALLEEGVDALCVSPLTSDNLTSALLKAFESHIPIIVVDDAQVAEVPVTTFVTTDQRAVGALAAHYLIDQNLTPGSKVAFVEGKAGSYASHMRKLGFIETVQVSDLQLVADQKIALEVRNLTTKNKKARNINFSARWGEIFGISGLVGAGRTELVRAIFGVDPMETGEVFIDGKQVHIKGPKDAIHLGMGFLTEDRKRQGLVLGMPVNRNITLTILDHICKLGVIQKHQRTQIAGDYVDRLSIKTPSQNQVVKFLSGGNQQKVVLAKWLATQARILIFDEPTRGIDVGAKMEVRELMNELVQQGVCIILISSELPELLGMCDRIMVMHEGSAMGEFDPLTTTEEEILHHASGLSKNC